MFKDFRQIVRLAQEKKPKVISVACAHEWETLEAIYEAKKIGIADAVLIGEKEKICAFLQERDLNIALFEIIDIKDPEEACGKALELVTEKKADILMKGLVDTSVILKAVLDKEKGLRSGDILSHVSVIQVPGYNRLFFVTDAAMNIDPDLYTKKQIIINAVQVAGCLGLKEPKVAVICASEKVNHKMPDTVDAQRLSEMNWRGEIKNCIVGGPFALDNAVSIEAARIKGISHPVAGCADILLVPDIEAGNILYKSMVYFANAKSAGIVAGAKAPVILTSRADSKETKLYSIALGVLWEREIN